VPDRIFRALLKLLPGDLRGDHGDEMESTFRAERRETRGLQLARLWAATVGDIFRTAPAEHLDVLARDARFALRTSTCWLGMPASRCAPWRRARP
jgi:hypothetical protein